MVQRVGIRAILDDARWAIAWFLVVIFFAASTWFIVTAFFNYYYTTNVTQYVVNFLSRLAVQDLALNYTCAASPCKIALGTGNKVLNLTVENPTASPLVLLLRESGGAKATVAVYGSARLEIRFNKPLVVEPASTNALIAASPRVVATNETTSANIRVFQIVGMESLFVATSTLAAFFTPSALATYLSKRPLTKMYYHTGRNYKALSYISLATLIGLGLVGYLTSNRSLTVAYLASFSWPSFCTHWPS